MATKNVPFYPTSQPLLGGKIQREYAPARNMAQSLMQAGGSMAPVQSWQEGMARALQGGIGGYMNYATMKAQGDREAAQSQGITKALKAANQMIPGMPGVPVGGYTGTVEGELGTPDIPAQRGGWQAFSDALPEGRDFNDARMRAAMGLMGQQEAEAAEEKAREIFLFEQGNTYRAPVKGTTDQENFAQYKNETLAAGKIPMSFQEYQHSDALASQGILYNPQLSAQPSAQQAVSPIVERVEENPEFMVQPNLLGSGATNQAIQPSDVNIQPSMPQPVNRPTSPEQLTIIPGGPADRANKELELKTERQSPAFLDAEEDRRVERARKIAEAKPLPGPAQKIQQDLLEKIGITSGIQADMNSFISQIDNKELDLGLFENYSNRLKTFGGVSTKQSRAFASFNSSLERMRNDSLRLNNGVQTEGDAQRAWIELFANLNDQKYVRERLEQIVAINKRGKAEQEYKLLVLRESYGKGSLPTGPVRKSVIGKSKPDGVTQIEWDNMTPAERNEF